MISPLTLVRRHGLTGTARKVMARVSPRTSWSKEFIWYAMDLHAPERPRRALAREFELRQGTVEDIALLRQLPSDPEVVEITPKVVADRLGSGATLWLVTRGSRTAFACWNFYPAAPLDGARDGVSLLPPDVVVLEDSISSPDFRGRGVAPGAWTAIADANRDGGLRLMVTKVDVRNASSRKAVEKAGFREAARLHLAGPIWRVRIRVTLRDGAFGWMKDVERN